MPESKQKDCYLVGHRYLLVLRVIEEDGIIFQLVDKTIKGCGRDSKHGTEISRFVFLHVQQHIWEPSRSTLFSFAMWLEILLQVESLILLSDISGVSPSPEWHIVERCAIDISLQIKV